MISPRSPGSWLTVGKLVEPFVGMGCYYEVVPGAVTSDEGEALKVRYLLNPENQRYVAIVDWTTTISCLSRRSKVGSGAYF